MSLKLFKSTAVTSGMTLISRITGLVRDVVFAGMIGASATIAADAFYIAFRIPNFFRRIFGEGAFSQAFVPIFTEYKATRSEEETRRFTSHMGGVFGALLFLITVVGVVAAPILVLALAPGYHDEPNKFQLTAQMLRIIFPYLMFISLVAMAAGILNSYGRFAVAAFTPVLLNLCLIIAALVIAPHMEQPVMALAWGVLIAGVLQLLFQLPSLARLHMLPRPRLRKDAGASRVFRNMVPAIFGSSVSQINMVVNTVLASFLTTGSVSWLYYSDRLMEFPLGVFGIALATVILPSLSKKHVNESKEEFLRLLDWALRLVFLIGVPASVGLIVLARPILTTLFQYGAFNALDVEMSAQALIAFSGGLLGFILVKVLAPGFYAQQDTKTPAKIAAMAFGANIVFSLILVFPLKHVGLALAISLGAFVNAGLLYWRLREQRIYVPLPGWLKFLLQVGFASGVMGLLLVWGTGEQKVWLNAGLWERIGYLTFWVLAGILFYIAVLFFTGLRPRHLLLKRAE